MKSIGIAATIGVLLALGLVYILHPLNGGALTLLLILCIGLAEIVMGIVNHFLKRRSETCSPGKSAPSS